MSMFGFVSVMSMMFICCLSTSDTVKLTVKSFARSRCYEDE